MTLTYNLMGEVESYSSNACASQGDEPIESTNPRKRKKTIDDSIRSKGKRVVNEETVQKRQRLGPSHFAMSRNVNKILTIEDESLAEIRIPSPILENIEPIQLEDDEPLLP